MAGILKPSPSVIWVIHGNYQPRYIYSPANIIIRVRGCPRASQTLEKMTIGTVQRILEAIFSSGSVFYPPNPYPNVE